MRKSVSKVFAGIIFTYLNGFFYIIIIILFPLNSDAMFLQRHSKRKKTLIVLRIDWPLIVLGGSTRGLYKKHSSVACNALLAFLWHLEFAPLLFSASFFKCKR